jgi:hypothetical protein
MGWINLAQAGAMADHCDRYSKTSGSINASDFLQLMFSWVVTSCNLFHEYRHFGGPSVSIYKTTRCYTLEDEIMNNKDRENLKIYIGIFWTS